MEGQAVRGVCHACGWSECECEQEQEHLHDLFLAGHRPKHLRQDQFSTPRQCKVQEFQRAHGIEVDGLDGPRTQAAAQISAIPVVLTTHVTASQTLLPVVKTLGLPDVPFTIFMDGGTVNAEICLVTQVFEEDYKLRVIRGYGGTTAVAHLSEQPGPDWGFDKDAQVWEPKPKAPPTPLDLAMDEIEKIERAAGLDPEIFEAPVKAKRNTFRIVRDTALFAVAFLLMMWAVVTPNLSPSMLMFIVAVGMMPVMLLTDRKRDG